MRSSSVGFIARLASSVGMVLALSVATGSAGAEPVRVVFYEGGHPPFMFGEGAEETGIYRDILGAIGERTGLEFEVVYAPVVRALKMFDEGEVDLEPGINPIWRQDHAVPGLFSIPFADSIDVLVFRQGKEIPVGTASALEGRRVGVIRGYVYPLFTEAFGSGAVIREDNASEAELLDKLGSGRYEQVVVNRAIAAWWMKRHSDLGPFVIGDVVGSAQIMMRLHPARAELLSAIDEAIRALVAAGEIESIYARYR